MKYREEADYNPFYSFTGEDYTEFRREAEQLAAEVQDYLEKNRVFNKRLTTSLLNPNSFLRRRVGKGTMKGVFLAERNSLFLLKNYLSVHVVIVRNSSFFSFNTPYNFIQNAYRII